MPTTSTTPALLRRGAIALAIALGLAACAPADEAPADGGPAATDLAASATPIDRTSASATPIDAAPAAATPPADAPNPTHPGLVVDTLDHGRFDLAAKRGQWVVVNFWATWCAPCLKEIPDLNALDARREDLEVIGLAFEEITPEAMRAFYVEKVKPEYPVAIVDVFNPPADFDVPRGLPFTILIQPGGAVGHTFLGPVTGADIESKISELAAVPASSPSPETPTTAAPVTSQPVAASTPA